MASRLITTVGLLVALAVAAIASWKLAIPFVTHRGGPAVTEQPLAESPHTGDEREPAASESPSLKADRTTGRATSKALTAFMVPHISKPDFGITKIGRPVIADLSKGGRYLVIYSDYWELPAVRRQNVSDGPERLWDLELRKNIPLPLALMNCRVSPDETLLAGISCDGETQIVLVRLSEQPTVLSSRPILLSPGESDSRKHKIDLEWSPDSKRVLVTWEKGNDGSWYDSELRWLPGKERPDRSSWITQKDVLLHLHNNPSDKAYQNLRHVKLIGEIFDALGSGESRVLALPPNDPDELRTAETCLITPDGSTLVWGIDNGGRGFGSVEQKSRFFDLETGAMVHAGPAILGFSPRGTFFLTANVSSAAGSEASTQADTITVWDARSRGKLATIQIERTDGGFDLCCTMDEKFLLVADQESRTGEQRVFALPSGEPSGKHAYLAGTKARPIGFRKTWEGVDFPKGPVEIWSPDGAAPEFVLGEPDGRRREAICSGDGSRVVTKSWPDDIQSELDERLEVWTLKREAEKVPLMSFRDQHMEAPPMRPVEQHYALTEAEQRAGWVLPAGAVTVAPKVSKDLVSRLEKGMRREDVQDLLGGVSHKVLLGHSRYDTKDTALGSIWIFEWIDVYAGEEPESSLWLHFRKDAELTYAGGTLVEIQADGFN